MALGDYIKTTYANNQAPAISATNLNNIENKVAELDTSASGLSVSKADLNSPAFTGTPTAPSASAATDTTQVASTAFVHDAITLDTDYLTDFRAWDTTRSYGLNDPVFYNGVPYKSLVVSNSGYTPDSNADKWEVTGGGGNATNAGYTLDNGDFEANVTGWTTYDNGASIVPTSGYGGSPSYVSISRVTTDPLVGVGSMLFTKSAGDAQGEGVASPFTIDLGVRQNPAEVSLEIETSVSGYADGDLGLFLYDITNSILIYPSITAIPATYAKPSTFKVVFSPNSTSGSYRLIFHVTSTNAFAWTAKIDNIQIGQKSVAVGAAISEWREYVPVVSGLGAGSYASVGRWRRVGSSMEIQAQFTKDGTPGSGSSYVLLSLPNGYNIDASKAGVQDIFGQVYGDASPNYFSVLIGLDSGAWNTLGVRTPGSALTGLSILAATAWKYKASVPISQWTSNVNLTEDFTEYAYNTQSTPNVSDTSSFGYGPEGTPFIANTQLTYYRVQFKKPIQIGDDIFIEIKGSTSNWRRLVGSEVATGLTSMLFQNNVSYGMGFSFDYEGSGFVTVGIGQYTYPAGASYAAPGGAWSTLSTMRWRVRKVSNGNMAEISGPGTAQQLGNFGYQVSKNKIINGAMDIWQRGNSGTTGYIADRWYVGGVTSINENGSGSPLGFRRNMLFNRATAGTAYLWQIIEAKHAYPLAGKQVTVQLQHVQEAYACTSISVILSYLNAEDDIAAMTTIQTITTTDVSTGRKIFNFGVLPTQAANGIKFEINYAVPSAAGAVTWRLTGVQLEEGSVATAFDDRPYGVELALCQRYYEKWVANEAYSMFGVAVGVAAVSAVAYYPFKVRKRIKTATIAGNASAANTFQTVSGPAVTSLGASGASEDGCGIDFGAASGYTAEKAYYVRANNSVGAYIGFDAEF